MGSGNVVRDAAGPEVDLHSPPCCHPGLDPGSGDAASRFVIVRSLLAVKLTQGSRIKSGTTAQAVVHGSP